jgi:hypothetical protein
MKTKQKANSRGQAMLEFALVGRIFFFCLFFATAIMLYEFERSLVVTGVTTGTRDAVSASAAAGSLPTDAASLDYASAQATKLMRGSLCFSNCARGGTNVIDLRNPPAGCTVAGIPCRAAALAAPCLRSGASPFQGAAPQGTIYVYATGSCGNNEIQVVAAGSPANLVGFLNIKIPLTIQATAVGVQYRR